MSTEIAIRSPISLFPSESEWACIKEQASMVVKTGFLPRAIDTAEKAIAIALKGRELGIPMMQAFSHIHIIQGKPTISAELMLSLIYKNCPGAIVDYLESTDKKCVIRVKRPGHSGVAFSFTIEEAKQAGLLAKDSWKNYPGAMLRARTVAIVARAVFPDAIMGCSYTPEELGAELDDEGDVIEIPASTPDPKPAQPEQKPAAQVPAAPAQPKARSRKEIGAAIIAAGNELGMQPPELEKFAEEEFKKSVRELSNAEMEKFLGELEAEIGRRSA